MKKKVVLVVKTFFPHTTGGIQEAVSQIIKVKNNEIDFEVVTTGPERKEYFYQGVKVTCFKESFSLSSNPISIEILFNIKSIFKKYDLIHIHSPWPFFEFLSLFFISSKKLFFTYHCGIFKFFGSNVIYDLFFQLLILKSKRVIFTSSLTLNKLNPFFGKKKCHVIPLWFDKERIKVSEPSLELKSFLKSLDKYAIFIGSLRWYKGLDLILNAAKNNPEFNVVIVGKGNLKKRLEKILAQKRITNVFLLGYLSDEDTFEFLRNSKFLLLPSTSPAEAFGNVLLEASYFKKPMITTEVGTATSYVNKDKFSGIVIKPNNLKQLEEAMTTLYKNSKLCEKMGLNAYNRLIDKFSEEKNFQKLKNFYLSEK